MRTIYAVSSGDYSSYHVWCTFETRALARGYCDEVERVAAEIEAADGFVSHQDKELRVEPFQLWDTLPVVKVGLPRYPGDDPKIDGGIGGEHS